MNLLRAAWTKISAPVRRKSLPQLAPDYQPIGRARDGFGWFGLPAIGGALRRATSVLAFRSGPEGPLARSGSLFTQQAVYPFFEWLAGVPDPDEVLKRTGRTRANLRELMRDAEVSQAMETRREAVVATPWRLEGGEDSEPAKFVASEISRYIDQLITALWNAIPFGYSVVELVYARNGGRFGLAGVYVPPFEWFKPWPDGGLRFFPQDGSGGTTGIPVIGEGGDNMAAGLLKRGGFLLATRNAESPRNPFGDALLSALYWPVTWRLQGWQLWLNFLDTFGAPIIVGNTPNYQAFVDAMKKQGVTRAVGFQGNATDKIQAITASTAGEFERLNNALNATIAKVVLGQTLTSDSGTKGSGSYALGKVHNEVRDDKRRADIRVICCAMQSLVTALWSLNAFPGEAPKFVMQDDVGLERERADRDAVLAASLGVRFTPEYVAEQYGLEADEDFTIADPAEQQPPQPAGTVPKETVKQAAVALRAGRFTPEQQQVEDGVDAILAKASQPITRAELLAAIRAARDQHDLAERLAVLIDKQDPAYAQLLARAQFAAHVLGYIHETEALPSP